MQLVGLTVERAVYWADELAGSEGRRLSVRADLLPVDTAKSCFALLTAERALIEFVLGLANQKDDICPRCFLDDWSVRGYVRDHLRGRRERINKHLSHLTWQQTRGRAWHTTPIVLVVDALTEFGRALDPQDRRSAAALRASLDGVQPAVDRLRRLDNPDLFDLQLLAASGASAP